MKQTVTRLHTGNSLVFRPRPIPKHAVLCWMPAQYQLEWGSQTFDRPHMRVRDGTSEYGVDMQVFFSTHEACPDKPDHYIKTATVRALQVTEETEVHSLVRERMEASAKIQPGGWLLQNPGGELYYNTAEAFSLRYEILQNPVQLKPGGPPTLQDHLFAVGPKRILALDGGGIRGRITLGILKAIESVVGSPLSNYFDLIGGTSTGSIIAAGLALGWTVDKLIELYDGLGREVFKGSFLRLGLWRAKFPSEPLARALEREFGGLRLGDRELKTGLAIVTKRLDTNSPWPIHNNPRGRYYGEPPVGGNWSPNKNYLLRQLVRASSAAPHFFDPERIAITIGEDGAFVDGGVSPHNNPALQLVLLAALKGYGFEWKLGADQLQLVSVGTGMWRVRHDAGRLVEQTAVANAGQSLLSLMDDCASLVELLIQWLSDSPTARDIDAEIGNLAGDLLGDADPLLSYVRYNPSLELEWLRSHLPEEKFDGDKLDALRRMDSPKLLEVLASIGDAAGRVVESEHFARYFMRK